MQQYARVQCCASLVKYLTFLRVKYIQNKNEATIKTWESAGTALGFVVLLVEFPTDRRLGSTCKALRDTVNAFKISSRCFQLLWSDAGGMLLISGSGCF